MYWGLFFNFLGNFTVINIKITKFVFLNMFQHEVYH